MSGGKTSTRVRLRANARRAFTLIELLVVISIIVLLMVLLFPALQKAKKQAQAVACQANLHQWALILNHYTTENEGRFFRHDPLQYGRTGWSGMLEPYSNDTGRLARCPGKVVGPYAKMHAGYAMNGYHIRSASPDPLRVAGINDRRQAETTWSAGHASGRYYAIPVLQDSHWWSSGLFCYPISHDLPPLYEGCTPALETMEALCTPRHGNSVNALFLDWSVRKVGLKELWTLKWAPEFDTSGHWTKRGGVLPEDWPPWMRKFKDY